MELVALLFLYQVLATDNLALYLGDGKFAKPQSPLYRGIF